PTNSGPRSGPWPSPVPRLRGGRTIVGPAWSVGRSTGLDAVDWLVTCALEGARPSASYCAIDHLQIIQVLQRPRAPADASLEGATDMSDKPSVLFVCVHNAGRSQMAAGWLRHLAGDRVEVRSAGSAPAETINPAAVEAMR